MSADCVLFKHRLKYRAADRDRLSRTDGATAEMLASLPDAVPSSASRRNKQDRPIHRPTPSSTSLARIVKELHVRAPGSVVMNPNVGVGKGRDRELGRGVEGRRDSPKQKEGLDVHAVAHKTEDAFCHQRHPEIPRIEMIGTGRPRIAEVSRHTIARVG